MAIAALALPQQPTIDNSIDFSPLAKLGNVQQDAGLAALAKQYGLPAAPGAPPAAPGAPLNITLPAVQQGGKYASAISGIESGGKYDLLGPVTKAGDRAYGKYQVMGANIPTWTKQALGYSMTPQQFLADPSAQDAVFNKIFGGYVDKYGPTGAAKAWFAGEGGMNDPGRSDQLGTTVDEYARRFVKGLQDAS